MGYENELKKTFTGAVKVMRSYDYCHFEIWLSKSDELSLNEIDEMRKEAARLVDKAVKQYTQAKNFYNWKTVDKYMRERMRKQSAEIRKITETDRTPEQKAILKSVDDLDFYLSREYDYQDDWDEGYLEDNEN